MEILEIAGVELDGDSLRSGTAKFGGLSVVGI